MKYAALFLGLFSVLNATIFPLKVIETGAAISDIVVSNGKIYTATDGSGVEVFDVKSLKKVNSIIIPKIKTPKGEKLLPKIYSVDHYKNTTIIVSESGSKFRNVYMIKEGKTSKIIDNNRGLLIKKARFLDVDHLLFGLTGDTIVLFDITKNALVYEIQAGGGAFRDMALSPSKKLVAVADEGGEIMMFNTKSGVKVKTLRGINLDNINHIDYKQNTILSAGQDRRVGVYQPHGSYYLETDFFVYAVGLSPSASKGVYTDGDENILQVFTLQDQSKGPRLQGGEVIFDTLIFLDEHRLIGAGEENKIYYWRIP